MTCTVAEQTIKLEAASVTWGREQCRAVTIPDDVAGSLNEQSFDLNVIDIDQVETKYLVVLDNGTSTVVAPSGTTLVTVSYTDGDAGSVIATAMQVAVDALANVSAEVISGNQVHIENEWIGPVTEEVRTNASLLSFTEILGIGGNLGRTNEGIEVAITTESTAINSNQTGSLVLDEIFQGQTASCTAAFIEISKQRLESIIAGAVGDTFTPSGGTKLIGGGDSRLFKSLKALGGKLILHPIRLDRLDRSEDFVFWKAAPKPDSINYDGTAQQALSTTFTAYLDDSKPSGVKLYAIGDWKQDGIVA